MRGIAGCQVIADLVIVLVLLVTCLVPEARKAGRNPWPWVVATLLLGSIGLLLYRAFAGAGSEVEKK
jgi:hypothetical protein